MDFAAKLNTLIKIFRLSNVSLSKGIGVDPSLISRWKSGERLPPKNGSVQEDLAEFLAGVPMLPHDRQALADTVGGPCERREDTARSLRAWLTGSAAVGSRPTEVRDGRTAGNAAEIIEQMKKVLSSNGGVPAGSANLWPYVQKGQPAEHEIFTGAKGKRQASVNFLHTVQSSGKPTDVYLMVWGDNGWMHEDAEFEKIWLKALNSLSQAGHRLHILVPKISNFHQLSAIFPLPLYQLGRCVLYTCPSETVTHPTLFVARGCGVVLSYGGQEEQTIFFKNIRDTSMFESVFLLWLQQSEPLFYNCDNAASYAQRLLQLEEKRGAYYSLKNGIGASLLPENVLYELLSRSLAPGEVAFRLDLLARRREIFEASLQRDTWVEIYPTAVFDAILINGSCRLSGAELFFDQDTTLSGEALAQFIKGLIFRLQNSPRLHIILLDDWDISLNISLKSNVGAFFSSSGSASAYLGEPGLLGDLEAWMASHKTDCAEVLSMLEDALDTVGM